VMTKSAPYGKRGKSRKKHRIARHSTPLASKQVSFPERIPTAPSAQPTPSVQQVVAQQPHVLGELRRSGIIAGAMLLLLIILSLVL
jgi:hypothetical protein